MALLELLETGADADRMRDMLAFAAERIMEAEVAAGAAKGARSPLREAQHAPRSNRVAHGRPATRRCAPSSRMSRRTG